MTNQVRHIVFDIGKVLLHYDPELPYRNLIPDEARRQWFLENVCTAEWNLEQDRGRAWAEAEADLIKKHPDEAENIRAFRRQWHEMVPHAYEPSVAIFKELLDMGHDVTMLTNFAADTFAEARQRYAFLQRPRGVTVSGEVGLIKPDRAIYDLHAKTFGLEPSAALFIDDSEKNVEGAKAAGWQAVHFTSPAQLRADLERHALLGVRV